MAKKTTVKPISLYYGDIAAESPANALMGVLKGLAIGQDTPDSTEIEAEFFDSPFDIFYDGKPVTMTFELANYELSELPALFGGSIDDNGNYEASANAFTSDHAWRINFQRGHAALYIYKGLTIGTIKKDADGALNYSVTITAMIYNDGTNDHMYKIIKDRTAQTYNAVQNPTGNPQTQGWYERDGSTDLYRLTWDDDCVTGKTYYTKA